MFSARTIGSTIDRSLPGAKRNACSIMIMLPDPISDCRRRTPSTNNAAANSPLTISQVIGSVSRTSSAS